MKVILDVNNFGELPLALQAFSEHQRQFPNAKLGESVSMLVRDQKFTVVKNANSTTIRAKKVDF